MAISITSTTDFSASASGGTSITITGTVSGVNTYGLAFVADEQGDTVTGVTWNGVSMTQLGKASRGPSDVGTLFIYIYGIVNPTTGNVIASRSGTTSRIVCGSASLDDARQTITPNAVTATQGSSTGTTMNNGSFTTTVGGCAILSYYCDDNGGISASTNLTALQDLTANYAFLRSTTFPQTTAGSFTGTVNMNATGNRANIIVGIEPVRLNTSNFLMFM